MFVFFFIFQLFQVFVFCLFDSWLEKRFRLKYSKTEDVFKNTSENFDRAFLYMYERNHPRMKAHVFAQTYRFGLLYWADAADFDIVVSAQKNGTTPNLASLRRIMIACATFRSMFAEVNKRSAYKMFLEIIKEWMKHLVDLNFEEGEISSFTRQMAVEICTLQKMGVATYNKKKSIIEFLLEELETILSDLNDEHYFRMIAIMKLIAISNGQTDRFVWEKVIHGETDKIVGVPETVLVPEYYLNIIQNGREQVKDNTSHCKTLRDYQISWEANARTILQADRTLVLDKLYLDVHAEPKLKEQLRTKTLEALPSEAVPKTYKESIDGLTALKRSRCVQLLGLEADRELGAMVTLVQQVQSGFAPGEDEFNRFGEHFKVCCKRFANFYQVVIPADSPRKGKLNFGPKAVCGVEALELRVGQIQIAKKKGLEVPLEDLRIFKTFSWVLSPAMKTVTEKWLDDARKLQIHQYSVHHAIKDVPVAAEDVVEESAPSAAVKKIASCSELDLGAVALTLVKKTSAAAKSKKPVKAVAAAAPVAASGNQDMMKFF